MGARNLACLGVLGPLFASALLCQCATAGTSDDSVGVDSGTGHMQQQGQDGGADSTIGAGDSAPAVDSGPAIDSGSLTTDTGSAAESGTTTDSATTATDSSSPADTGGPPGDSGHDAPADSAHDASDSSTAVDTGSAADTSMGGTCQPGSTVGFTPTNVTALNDNQACTGPQINSLVTSCFDPAATAATCMAWQTSNAVCFNSCTLFSSYSATNVTPGMSPPPGAMGPWGPFIAVFNPGESDFLNLGACVSLADPTQTACGDALTQAFECEYDVCASSCAVPAAPADPTAAETAYNNCTAAADGCPASGNGPCTGVCGTYVDAINNQCGTAALTGPAAFCLDGSLSSTSGATADPSLEKLIKHQCVN